MIQEILGSVTQLAVSVNELHAVSAGAMVSGKTHRAAVVITNI